MKNHLKNFMIAVTGDFGQHRTHEKIRQWIELAGGIFAPKIDSDVTHLVASKEHYKKNVLMVQQARRIPGLCMVNFDWLEDSLMKGSPRKVTNYLWQRRVKIAAKAKQIKKAATKERVKKGLEAYDKGCKQFKIEMFSNGYHLYHDATTFTYDITLARINLTTNKNERYNLKLYESHTIPLLYAAYVKYNALNSSAKHILAPIGSSFETAFAAWKKFFKAKTKGEWDQRLERQKESENGDEEKAFVYVSPEEGEPRGLMLWPEEI